MKKMKNLFKESFKTVINKSLRPVNEAELATEMQGELGAEGVEEGQAEFEAQMADEVDSIVYYQKTVMRFAEWVNIDRRIL